MNVDLARFDLHSIPGISALFSLGQYVLLLGLLILTTIEIYRLTTEGRCDLISPILRVGFGSAVLRMLPWIGSAFTEMAQSVGNNMADAQYTQVFVAAYAHAVGHTGDYSTTDFLWSLGSTKAWFSLMSIAIAGLMMITKFIMIDILWPIAFNLMLVLGVIAVPLGVLPGFTLASWFKNMVEVSLWPIIFQLLIGLMVTMFSGLLKQVQGLDFSLLYVQAAAQAASGETPALILAYKWWAFCLVYVFLTLLTPFIAMMVTRGTPVGAAAGAAMALGTSLAFKGVAMASAAAGMGRFASAPSAGASGASTAGAGQSDIRVTASSAPEAKTQKDSIDHREPPLRMPEDMKREAT